MELNIEQDLLADEVRTHVDCWPGIALYPELTPSAEHGFRHTNCGFSYSLSTSYT